MPNSDAPLILLNAVGLTRRLLPMAPRLNALAEKGAVTSLKETLPAVTSTAQASVLTGVPPSEHGAVANGWLFRDTREIRFWQQSNSLLMAEPIYETLRRERAAQGKEFSCAKLFWWFNQGAEVEYSLTPKPYYGCDGNKVFDITGTPDGLSEEVKKDLGPFPFHTFWGPAAGPGSTEWIADSAAWILERHRPSLSLVYLPHLDYDPQRFGPSGCDMGEHVRALDDACANLLDTAERLGARVWVVSEYGHVDVDQPIFINKALRKAGLLLTRDSPFGEGLDTFNSEAMAVVDHQLTHVYVRHAESIPAVREIISALPGVDRIYEGDEQGEIGLDHARSGELIALAKPNAWFAYPYWIDDARAPDFARTVDIHRKPGFDPCEMFFDPNLAAPKARVIRKVIAKKLGFRVRMDVIPLDPAIVRGSHGLAAEDPLDRPLFVRDRSPNEQRSISTLEEVHGELLRAFGVERINPVG